MNVSFAHNCCGFIFFLFLNLYSDDLEIVLFAVRIILHEPYLVWKVIKGSVFLLHWWKLKFTLEDKSVLESHFPCTREEKQDWEKFWNYRNKWLSSDNDMAGLWQFRTFSTLRTF